MVTAETPTLAVTDRYQEHQITEFRARGWWQGGSASALLDRCVEANSSAPFVSDGTNALDYGTASSAIHRRVVEGLRPHGGGGT